MSKLTFFDSTLRDGSHAIKHQLTKENIENYCQMIDSAGLDAVIVGHGNGLGASSLQVGLSLLSDEEMIKTARENLQKTKLGAYLIPGFGTIKDNIEPAIELGIDFFKIGCHCTEADTTRQHIEFLRKKNIPVYGILMMYHMAGVERIIEETRKMEEYGATGVIIMDSAGASTPELVKRTISSLCEYINVPIGFHAHNNLGLAVSNTYIAIQEGAKIVDATLRGFGAGAGNCQMETLIALLQKENIETKVDLFKILDISEKIIRKDLKQEVGIDDFSIVNGLAGVFSTFKPHVLRAAENFKVDGRKIILELGKRKVVGGQEDMIIDVAQELKKSKDIVDDSYYLSNLL